ncbi:hypothetical protein [Planococcus glaciei]|uniref:hypothetical protein n=1 Tax=Planococcus glaciei TaxID=459472 RepID=UPI001C73D6CC|nr:hypothetical protein [Planococcus glaciei]MBX0316425.1 hypothetical protein [Planococcus glaciei]
MIEKLLKDQAAPAYFVYLTNGANPFPKVAQTIPEIFHNLREEAPMGYTALWLLKRIGLATENQQSYFSENDVLTSEDTKHPNEQHPYITFRFVQINGTSPMYTSQGAVANHSSYEEAASYAAEELKKSKERYPERDFQILIARLIEKMNWH